jgi:hypothetical protein
MIASEVQTGDGASRACGCARGSDAEGNVRPLSLQQRIARASAGMGFLAVAAAALRWPRTLAVPTSLVAGWLGASHVVAAVTDYCGCPELGAIPTLVRGRRVETRCGPWELLDRRFALDGISSHHGAAR